MTSNINDETTKIFKLALEIFGKETLLDSNVRLKIDERIILFKAAVQTEIKRKDFAW